jgi:hypothetical protein
LHIDESHTPQLVYRGIEEEQLGDAADLAETAADKPTGDGANPDTEAPQGRGNT